MELAPVKKALAQFCYCETCDSWLGCQYWSLSKSAALHKRGTGHDVKFYAVKVDNCGGCNSSPCQCKTMVMVARG